MELKPGYKQTEVGIIPEDWAVTPLGDLFWFSGGLPSSRDQLSSQGFCYLHYGDIHLSKKTYIDIQNESVNIPKLNILLKKVSPNFLLEDGDVVFVDASEDEIGTNKHVVIKNSKKVPFISGLHTIVAKSKTDALEHLYRRYCFQAENIRSQFRFYAVGTKVLGVSKTNIAKIFIPIPPKSEQSAIATVLSDTDSLIESLEQLIAKKRLIKQGTMQELLTGKRRLPGFAQKTGYKQTEVGVIPEDWEILQIQEVSDCLDNLRVPLNEAQRLKIQGDYPYCGANGVLDHINDFLIDDDIILIAEDGGYFDEYETRPIAYRMTGKIWVNNHAHILKARPSFSQGFLFYSLVHKNILQYLASGTRAKLNRAEMNKILLPFPPSKPEQESIATVLLDMDEEITSLEEKLSKLRQIKQGMMQELLTGMIRLV